MIKKLISIFVYICQNWYTYWVKFLTIFGNIRVYKTPCWVVYDPNEYEYKVRGQDIRDIEKLIQPGDVVLRNYEHYLDALVIPGEYSHSGIYVGDNKVVHATAEGVNEIDLIDFFQCDKACVLRPNVGQDVKDMAVGRAKKWIGTEYDFVFNSSDSSAFYCHELTATCYADGIKIEKFYPTVNGKEIKLLRQKYLADSFLTNSVFVKVYPVDGGVKPEAEAKKEEKSATPTDKTDGQQQASDEQKPA